MPGGWESFISDGGFMGGGTNQQRGGLGFTQKAGEERGYLSQGFLCVRFEAGAIGSDPRLRSIFGRP